MSTFKKFTVGIFLSCNLLTACAEQTLTKPEKLSTQEKEVTQNLKDSNTILANERAHYSIYGGWITDTSYIMISNGSDEKTLENIVKRNEKKDIIHFKLADAPSGNKLTAIKESKERSNRSSFFTLELNKDKDELTITMPNEKTVTYKKATINPDEFNPEFVW